MGPVLTPTWGYPVDSGVGDSTLQVPLTLCQHCAPQALEAAIFRWGAASQSPCCTQKRSWQTLSKTRATPLLEVRARFFSGPGLTAGMMPSLCHTSE